MVPLTIFWLGEVIGPKVGELLHVGKGRCAKRLSHRLCQLLRSFRFLRFMRAVHSSLESLERLVLR